MCDLAWGVLPGFMFLWHHIMRTLGKGHMLPLLFFTILISQLPSKAPKTLDHEVLSKY